MVKWPIMDPHAILAWLFNSAGLEIPTDELQLFWRKSRANGERWALLSDATEDVIPIGLYGDSATIQLQVGSTSVVGLWMNLPLFRPKSVRFSRMLLCALPEDRLYKHFTLNALYRRIVWSCNAASSGFHPREDLAGRALPPHMAAMAGKPICETRFARFSVTEIRGDWSWHLKTFRFDASWASTNCCWQCPATLNGQWNERYYNFEGTASWEGCAFDFGQFMARKMPSSGICALVTYF